MIASSVHCGTVEMCLEKARIKSNSRQSNGRSWSAEQPDIRCHILRCSAPRWFSMRPKVGLMTKSPAAWTPAGRSSANGASAFSKSDWPGWKNAPDRVAPGLFPPELIVQVKALACELPVHRAKLFGRCEAKSGIAPFDRLVAQVMNQEPYRSARRASWLIDT